MRKGTITKARLKEINKIVESSEILDKWVDRLCHEEPEFYDWMHKMTGKVINDMSRNIDNFDMKIAEKVAHIFLMSFITGWIIYKDVSDEYIGKMLEPEDHGKRFQNWLDGKLSAAHYDYSLRGLRKDSTKYKAKKAYTALQKELEHRSDFINICKKINKKEEDSFLGKFKEGDNKDGRKNKRRV